MKFTKHTMHINLRLDNNIIPEHKTLNHVGINLENGFNTTERSIAAQRLIRSLSMSIIKQGIHPIVCSKIILQLCYTKALFGRELWNNLANNEMLLLERAHRYVCKYVQGLPKLTRTHKCITLLGWTSIECQIDTKKKPVVVNPTTIRSRQMLNSMCLAVLYMIGGAMMNKRLYDKTPKRLLIDE